MIFIVSLVIAVVAVVVWRIARSKVRQNNIASGSSRQGECPGSGGVWSSCAAPVFHADPRRTRRRGGFLRRCVRQDSCGPESIR